MAIVDGAYCLLLRYQADNLMENKDNQALFAAGRKNLQ